MPQAKLKVSLLTCTPEPEKACALAAKMCYAHIGVDDLITRVEEKDQEKFLRSIVSMGHLSVLEHASFTFVIEGVSRALLAQITRHRIASFSVQSQRYVSLADGFQYIIPPRIQALGAEAVQEYEREMAQMHLWYTKWQEQLGENSNEDARFVLPNACETRMTLTMNARELLHFFSLRCCERAQWEIRALAIEMLKLCKEKAPVIFENAGPACVRGACSEGAKSCGQAAQKRAFFQAL